MYDLHGQIALVTAAADPADGAVNGLPGMLLSALDGIPCLEAEPRMAALSTNQVSLWGAFRLAQIHLALPGFGRLLQEP